VAQGLRRYRLSVRGVERFFSPLEMALETRYRSVGENGNAKQNQLTNSTISQNDTERYDFT
jgi:hypothetical protein